MLPELVGGPRPSWSRGVTQQLGGLLGLVQQLGGLLGLAQQLGGLLGLAQQLGGLLGLAQQLGGLLGPVGWQPGLWGLGPPRSSTPSVVVVLPPAPVGRCAAGQGQRGSQCPPPPNR